MVSQGWPSVLLALNSLSLPLEGAFFPTQFHHLFKHRQNINWHPPEAFAHAHIQGAVIFLLSGTLDFVSRMWNFLPDPYRVIVNIVFDRRGLGHNAMRKATLAAKSFIHSLGLRLVSWSDEFSGGVTDAVHLFGFGSGLVSSVLPRATPNLSRSLGHYVDGGAKGFGFTLVDTPSLPVVAEPLPHHHRKVHWHEGAILPEGLLPCAYPDALVYCPTHFHKGKTAKRRLTIDELLRAYQVPSDFDAFFRTIPRSEGTLPFEWVPSQDIYADILRQLWKCTGGVLIYKPRR